MGRAETNKNVASIAVCKQWQCWVELLSALIVSFERPRKTDTPLQMEDRFDHGDGVDYSPAFATNETFATNKEAVAYMKGIANIYNMELSVSSHKDNSTILLCHKGGRYQDKQVDENVRARLNTKIQMTGCLFRVTIYKIYDRWAIRVYPGPWGMENHSLKDPPRVSRPLSAEVKELIKKYSKAGTKTVHILRAIWTQFPDEKVTSKQVYNYRNQLRKEGFPILDDLAAMDVVGKVLEVAEQHKYIIFTECDEETQRDVEKNVKRILNGNANIAKSFAYKTFKTVIEAANREDYEEKVQFLEHNWSQFQPVLEYVRKIWLVVADKFVHAWTNTYLHLGNTTTYKVESTHKLLKEWLGNANASFETVWHRVHMLQETQLTQIREKLQESRQKIGRQHNKYPFYQLRCNVSHYCLDLLNNELERAQQLGDDVYWECNHYLKQTHSIPCACILKRVMEANEILTPKYLHQFWSTLDIGEVTEKDSSDDVPPHRLLFRQLVEEMDTAEEPIQREITRLMYNKLYLRQAGWNEPRVGKRGKGMPKKRGISKRKQDKPNVWAYRDGSQGGTNTSDSIKAGTSQGTSGQGGTNTRSSSRGHTSGAEDQSRGPILLYLFKCVKYYFHLIKALLFHDVREQVHGLGKVGRTPAIPVEATRRVLNPMAEVRL
ncbi:OLC1v1013248C1 [Oldenlandia corymbosa var. corymbosa]|uniref:OLC1v1013248C1 n=1 Tax=Oldenlandia corymbosa var. corymbosa TaxID=529605 RepID=A0AAV1E1E1_OLDCO|nr:OLC1v1013248C1 [Oldenlandia corymbosa var. corymbosa]